MPSSVSGCFIQVFISGKVSLEGVFLSALVKITSKTVWNLMFRCVSNIRSISSPSQTCELSHLKVHSKLCFFPGQDVCISRD